MVDFERGNLLFGIPWLGEMIPAEESVDERVPFPVRSGYLSEIRVRFWRKVTVAGHYPVVSFA